MKWISGCVARIVILAGLIIPAASWAGDMESRLAYDRPATSAGGTVDESVRTDIKTGLRGSTLRLTVRGGEI